MRFRKRPSNVTDFDQKSSEERQSTSRIVEEIDVEALAKQLEQAFQKLNRSLLDFAGIPPEDLVANFVDVQARLLGFDEHGRAAFVEAIEAARVKTLSQGNVFLGCALCSAIALSQYKNQPRPTKGRLSRYSRQLRQVSTHTLSLGAFATLSFYALLGSKGFLKLRKRWKNRAIGI